jgi:hypothetical protein
MRIPTRFPILAALAAVLALGACDASDEGSGTLKVELWGEDYIESGIPADEFADGWAIAYDRFLVNLGGLTVAEEGGTPVVADPVYRIWDLASFDGARVLAEAAVPAADYVHTAYSVAAATAASVAGNAAESDVQRMKAGGLSVLVEGHATKGDRTVAFSWAFTTGTTYDPCHSGGKVADGGTATIQVTVHGDHLFYDDAASEDPSLRFETLADADADADGTVTSAELAAVQIAPLDHYGVGSLDIDNLWEYLSHMTTTLGHIDGEGHCETH